MKVELPKFKLAKIRSGVRPGKVEQTAKDKQTLQRHPKHRKNWRDQMDFACTE